jgi:hypothetical protein
MRRLPITHFSVYGFGALLRECTYVTPKKLTDFYGAFATRSRSASKTEMRQRVSDYLAQKHKLIQE